MGDLKEYNIKFVNLKSGSHEFSYKVGKEFFDAFEYSEIAAGEVSISMTLEKSTGMLVLNFLISGFIDSECDLCLDPVQIDVEGKFRQIVKLAEDEESSDEEIIFIPPSEFEINVSPFIFEFIHLCIPAKKQHEEGKCNIEVQSKLNEYMLTETDEVEEQEEIDPRWEVLKALKINKEE